MEDNALQLHEFFIEGGNAERSHALLHITEPSTPEEKRKGYFFAVCEIIGSTADYIEELQQTIDTIEKGYYENSEQTNAEALETVLDLVNKQSAHIVRRGTELHWMVGVVADTEIIFSFHGRPTILLFYKNKEGLYQPLDLVAQNPVERTTNPTVFSQIIQGKISPHDYLAITTPHVREFYDHDRLQRIVTTRSAEESCRHFERALQESKRELSFAGVIITVGRTIERRPAPAPRIPQMSRGSSESLQQLFSTQKNTSETLTSSLGKTMQNGFDRLTKRDKKTHQAVSSIFEKPDEKNQEEDFLSTTSSSERAKRAKKWNSNSEGGNDTIVQIFRVAITIVTAVGKSLLKLVVILASTLAAMGRFFGTLFLMLINYQDRRQIILDNWKRSIFTFRDHIYHLPLLTKIFFSLTILLVIGVSGSMVYFNHQNKITTARKEFTATAGAVEKYLENVDVSLTFQNDNDAFRQLTSAKDTFAKLPCSTTKEQSQKDRCQKLQAQIDDMAVKLRKVSSVQVELVTSFEGITSPLTGLAKVNTVLMANSPSSPTIALYNILSKELSTVSAPSSTPGFIFSATTPGKEFAVFSTASNELFALDPKTKTLKKQLYTFSKNDISITNLLMYSSRLYTLDAEHLQVYRHERITNGFSRGVDWIKSGNENLRDAISFAIDGDLYALKKNGTIAKYTAGEPQTFAIQNLEPALTSGQALFTYDGFAYLYILDSTEGRIIVVSKSDSSVKAQLSTPELKNASSFVIEETNKIGYFLSGNKVYKIGLGI